jgi:hypothetical protein
MGKMGDTWKGVETSTRTGETYQGLTMGGSIKEDILFWKPGQQERIFFKYWTAF